MEAARSVRRTALLMVAEAWASARAAASRRPAEPTDARVRHQTLAARLSEAAVPRRSRGAAERERDVHQTASRAVPLECPQRRRDAPWAALAAPTGARALHRGHLEPTDAPALAALQVASTRAAPVVRRLVLLPLLEQAAVRALEPVGSAPSV